MVCFFIQKIDQTSTLLGSVRELADEHSDTLGFLPYQAFQDYARRKGILIACTESGELAGYLLFRIVERKQQATIVHLCVDEAYRGKGVGRQLFEALCKETEALRGIGLYCRRDYISANKVWRQLGFTPRDEKPGRGHVPSQLTFWWFGHDHKTLFDLQSKIRTVVDANIFFSFESRVDKDAKALLADWLQDDIEICITPELFYEIHRGREPGLRTKQLRRAKDFVQTKATKADFDRAYGSVCEILGPGTTENEISDRKHLAWSIADKDSKFFVTRDQDLLDATTRIYDMCGHAIVDPTDLILHLDELRRMTDYQGARLAGTNIRQRRVQKGEQDKLAQVFQLSAIEKKHEFLAYIRGFLGKPNDYAVWLAEGNENDRLALFAYDCQEPDTLNIPLFRLAPSALDDTLARYFSLQFVHKASHEKRLLTRISEPKLSSTVLRALQGDSFVHTGDAWVRPNLKFALPAFNVAEILKQLVNNHPELEPSYRVIISVLEAGPHNTRAMVDVERMLWPVKITDAEIPTIAVPITPHWASQWFDAELGSQTLWGARVDRALNREGVYYSTARKPNIDIPGRILWYVTKSGQIPGTSALRACSRLDDIVIGKPKEVFKQFKHLGVYEWSDIVRNSSPDTDKPIMALRFSDTELFEHPVTRNQWNEISRPITGHEAGIYSPTVVDKQVFEELYKIGMGIS
jgi:GNAT superfamily N-acetyltransferase